MRPVKAILFILCVVLLCLPSCEPWLYISVENKTKETLEVFIEREPYMPITGMEKLGFVPPGEERRFSLTLPGYRVIIKNETGDILYDKSAPSSEWRRLGTITITTSSK
jgi:hypothetical protein